MSLYVSHPEVPAARIHTYPKRRRLNDVNIRLSAPRPAVTAATPNQVCYADFFAPAHAEAVAS